MRADREEDPFAPKPRSAWVPWLKFFGSWFAITLLAAATAYLVVLISKP